MFGLVCMNRIKKDFDGAMEREGYVRAKVMCEKWGITTSQFNKAFQKGYTCDSFIVNNVRYVSIYADPPAMVKPKEENAATKETEPEAFTITVPDFVEG